MPFVSVLEKAKAAYATQPHHRGKEAEYKPCAKRQLLESLQPGEIDGCFKFQQRLLAVLLALVVPLALGSNLFGATEDLGSV